MLILIESNFTTFISFLIVLSCHRTELSFRSGFRVGILKICPEKRNDGEQVMGLQIRHGFMCQRQPGAGESYSLASGSVHCV